MRMGKGVRGMLKASGRFVADFWRIGLKGTIGDGARCVLAPAASDLRHGPTSTISEAHTSVVAQVSSRRAGGKGGNRASEARIAAACEEHTPRSDSGVLDDEKSLPCEDGPNHGRSTATLIERQPSSPLPQARR